MMKILIGLGVVLVLAALMFLGFAAAGGVLIIWAVVFLGVANYVLEGRYIRDHTKEKS